MAYGECGGVARHGGLIEAVAVDRGNLVHGNPYFPGLSLPAHRDEAEEIGWCGGARIAGYAGLVCRYREGQWGGLAR